MFIHSNHHPAPFFCPPLKCWCLHHLCSSLLITYSLCYFISMLPAMGLTVICVETRKYLLSSSLYLTPGTKQLVSAYLLNECMNEAIGQ